MPAITKSPLPQLDSATIQELGWAKDSELCRAYDTVLQAEEHVVKSKLPEGQLVSVRVAGYLFLEFFAQSHIFDSIQPSEELVSWFISPPQSPQSTQHDVIIEYGTLLRDKFIRQFRTVTTPYSQPSSHPSRASFDTLEGMIKATMEATGTDYRTSRKKMLARDGYRCVITGILNEASYESNPQVWQSDDLRKLRKLPLHAAHIFNESTMQGIDPAVEEDNQGRLLNKTRAASGALAVLESFGFSEFTKAFKEAGGVHKVWNLLTLQIDLHIAFDNLKLWFEYEKPHRYKVCTLNEDLEGHIHDNFKGHDRKILGAPMVVEFNAQHKEAPPPHPILLTLHAMCARVAHMSGAAEFFDQIERDKEETMVLAFDGSSASLLSHLLSPHATIHGIA